MSDSILTGGRKCIMSELSKEKKNIAAIVTLCVFSAATGVAATVLGVRKALVKAGKKGWSYDGDNAVFVNEETGGAVAVPYKEKEKD